MLNHLVRFVMVGGSATLLQFVLLFIFVEYGDLTYVPSAACSFPVSAIYSSLMNYSQTFASETSHVATASKFVLVAALGLAINSSTFALLIYLGLHYLSAQVGATAVTL